MPPANKYRASLLIDGFNVYHSLLSQTGHKYMWFDYFSFFEKFIRQDQCIADVFYFTALANWKPDSVRRHKIFISALKNKGVKVVLGRFKKKERYCPKCTKYFNGHEEKQTDVNIAVYLLKEAVKNNYDTAYIMTNDTDIIPAIKAVKELRPDKKIGIIFPLGRKADELKQVCDFYRFTKRKHFSNNQLPETINLPAITLTRPASWV